MSTDRCLRQSAGYLLLLLLLSSCSGGVPQELQVSNYAGEGRNRSWPNVNMPAFENFGEVEIDGLDGGLLGPPLSLGNRDLVALATGQRLILIRNNRLHWSTTFDEGLTFLPELASDARGQIYIQSTDAELFAVDTGGSVLWNSRSVMVDEGGFGLPLYPLALENHVIVGNTDGRIAGVGPDGTELWQLDLPTKLTRSVASAGEWGIALGQTQNAWEEVDTLTMISSGGEIRWKRPAGGRIEVGPVCSGDRVAVGVSRRTEEGKYRPEVVLYDAAEGRELWRAPLRELPGSLVIDHEANVYVSGGGGAQLSGGSVASFSPEGKKRWEFGFRRSVPSTLLIAGNLYFVAHQDRSLGVYSYTREGKFLKYAPIDTPLRLALPPTILPTGSMVVAIREEGKILRN